MEAVHIALAVPELPENRHGIFRDPVRNNDQRDIRVFEIGTRNDPRHTCFPGRPVELSELFLVQVRTGREKDCFARSPFVIYGRLEKKILLLVYAEYRFGVKRRCGILSVYIIIAFKLNLKKKILIGEKYPLEQIF